MVSDASSNAGAGEAEASPVAARKPQLQRRPTKQLQMGNFTLWMEEILHRLGWLKHVETIWVTDFIHLHKLLPFWQLVVTRIIKW